MEGENILEEKYKNMRMNKNSMNKNLKKSQPTIGNFFALNKKRSPPTSVSNESKILSILG